MQNQTNLQLDFRALQVGFSELPEPHLVVLAFDLLFAFNAIGPLDILRDTGRVAHRTLFPTPIEIHKPQAVLRNQDVRFPEVSKYQLLSMQRSNCPAQRFDMLGSLLAIQLVLSIPRDFEIFHNYDVDPCRVFVVKQLGCERHISEQSVCVCTISSCELHDDGLSYGLRGRFHGRFEQGSCRSLSDCERTFVCEGEVLAVGPELRVVRKRPLPQRPFRHILGGVCELWL